mmetsp:Transcript_12735/g.42517  ORF Transcript_12735/g.42517 Transcript_12735/m.42517 type:complete len:213 (-) Transcript_12735:30-668(-)
MATSSATSPSMTNFEKSSLCLDRFFRGTVSPRPSNADRTASTPTPKDFAKRPAVMVFDADSRSSTGPRATTSFLTTREKAVFLGPNSTRVGLEFMLLGPLLPARLSSCSRASGVKIRTPSMVENGSPGTLSKSWANGDLYPDSSSSPSRGAFAGRFCCSRIFSSCFNEPSLTDPGRAPYGRFGTAPSVQPGPSAATGRGRGDPGRWKPGRFC